MLPNGAPFAEALHTQRLDGGLVSHWLGGDGMDLDGRLSVTSTRLDRVFGVQRVVSTQTTVYGEVALSGTVRDNAWVAGLAFQHDGLFAQDEYSPATWLKVAGSARIDSNNEYGTFFSPRFAALMRQPGGDWSLRASAGGGYAAPTPFVDEVDATGLGALLPLRGLHAERGVTESVDAKWADEGWNVNVSVFDSEIRGALAVQGAPGETLQLFNAPGPRRAPGAEVLIHYEAGPLQAIGSWSHINATEELAPGMHQEAPLVPRAAGGLGAIFENKRPGRVGIEVGYTGRQALEDDPYRRVSEPYFEWNALGELYLGGNAITEIWAPLDGRTFNLGIRTEL